MPEIYFLRVDYCMRSKTAGRYIIGMEGRNIFRNTLWLAREAVG